MAEVVLKKGQGRSLKAGGLGVYDNEVDKITGEFSDGDFVDVLDFDGYFLGKGFINTKSKQKLKLAVHQSSHEVNQICKNGSKQVRRRRRRLEEEELLLLLLLLFFIFLLFFLFLDFLHLIMSFVD